MKKILSIMLVICMMLSMAVMFAVPAAAVDGMWEVYGSAREHRDDFDEEEEEYRNVPGYEYVPGVGLQTIDPECVESSPKVGVQTKEMVDLKAGVYMLVRVENFSYDADDKWFAFSVSDTKYVDVGSEKADVDGERVVALVRGGETAMSEVQWRYSNYKWSDRNYMPENAVKFDEDGKALLELVITWDGSKYNMSVNGAPIHKTAQNWMTEHFADGMAYVGINMQNNMKGGVADLTILKYGTSKATAIVPQGDDSREPENVEHLYAIADIADPDEVYPGDPAILMNGSRSESDSKYTVKTTNNEWLTDENYRHVVASATKTELSFSVKNDVSYDLKDFPIVAVLTRNFCTCDDDCWAFEEANMYVLAGDVIAAGDAHRVSNIGTGCEDVIEVDGDNYLYFLVDTANEAKTEDLTGRIHGVRFDALGVNLVNAGRNEFDVCFVAFFRSTGEAEDYIYDFLGLENPNADDDPDETTEETTDETEETTEETTTETTEATTEATTETTEETTEATTEATTETTEETTESTEETTAAKVETTEATEETEETEEETDKTPEQTTAAPSADDVATGCFGTVGMSAFALIVVACGAGFVAFKKRR